MSFGVRLKNFRLSRWIKIFRLAYQEVKKVEKNSKMLIKISKKKVSLSDFQLKIYRFYSLTSRVISHISSVFSRNTFRRRGLHHLRNNADDPQSLVGNSFIDVGATDCTRSLPRSNSNDFISRDKRSTFIPKASSLCCLNVSANFSIENSCSIDFVVS